MRRIFFILARFPRLLVPNFCNDLFEMASNIRIIACYQHNKNDRPLSKKDCICGLNLIRLLRAMTFVPNCGINKQSEERFILHTKQRHLAEYGNSVRSASVVKIQSEFKEKS